MGILDWLLSDPTQAGGGFLAGLLSGKAGGAGNGSALPAAPYAGTSSLLGESPLINLLRSGFAGMNAANGYDGFGSQFSAGVAGGADAMARRRQQTMQDRLDALALKSDLAGKDGPLGRAAAAMPQSPGGGNQPAAEDAPAGHEPLPAGTAGIPGLGPPGTPGSCASCAARGQDQGLVPVVTNDTDFLKIRSGERFVGPDGILRRKP